MNTLITELKVKLIALLDLTDLTPDDFDENARLVGGDLGIDSIDLLEMVVMIERDYGVVINNQEIGEKVFATLTTLAAYIQEHMPGEDCLTGEPVYIASAGIISPLGRGLTATEQALRENRSAIAPLQVFSLLQGDALTRRSNPRHGCTVFSAKDTPAGARSGTDGHAGLHGTTRCGHTRLHHRRDPYH